MGNIRDESAPQVHRELNTYTLMLEAEVQRLVLESIRLQAAVQQLIPVDTDTIEEKEIDPEQSSEVTHEP